MVKPGLPDGVWRSEGNSQVTSEILAGLLAAQESGDAVALATIVRASGSVPRHAGTKMLVFSDGRFQGTVGGGELEARIMDEALAALAEGQPRLIPYSLVDPERGDPGVCGGEVEVFIEPYLPPATVLVVGCGHVGRSVAQLAKWLGYRVAVNDDRAELVTPEELPEADIHLPGSIDEAMSALKITANTYVVVVTRNVLVDRQILPKLLPTSAPYIGVIGSRRRWQETMRLLREDGLAEADLARFRSPIGLEINAETPEEIALSILAEIVSVRRAGTARQKPAAKEARRAT